MVDRIYPCVRFDGYTATPVDYNTSTGAFGARVVVGVLDRLNVLPFE